MPASTNQDLFAKVRSEFERRGLLGRALRFSSGGGLYSMRCDLSGFTIYRINSKPHLPPGLPGWTVCRLSPQECIALADQRAVCPPPREENMGGNAAAWVALAISVLEQGTRE